MSKQHPATHTPMLGKSHHSIGRSLLLWFLLLSLVPLMLTAWLGYRQAVDGLMVTTIQGLEQGAQSKAQFIQNWFDYRFMDLSSQAKNKRNTELLIALHEGLKANGNGLAAFVKSSTWSSLVSRQQQDLVTFARDYDYVYDVFLIDSEGNILFTAAQESDLGTNLFNGPYAATHFAHTAKRSLEQGQMLFSDLERYAPSNNILAGFIIAPVSDDHGNKQGLFAIQMRIERIQNIMQSQSTQTSLSHYLVGEDGLLRTPIRKMGMEVILTQRVDTEQVKLWRHEHGSGGQETYSMHETSFVYRGADGHMVVGIHHAVNLRGTHWGLISEVDQDEALLAAHHLAKIILVALLITAVMVVILAAYLARRLARPIIQLAEASMSAAAGKLNQHVSIEAENEIGVLAEAFNHMLVMRQKHLRALQRSHRKAEKALADLAVQKYALDQHAIVGITDVRGTIIYANDLFTKISGYSRDELLGSNHSLMKSGRHSTAFFRDMYRTIGKGKVWQGEICNKTKDGCLYWLETSIVPFIGEDGKPESYISIRTDITKRVQVERALRDSEERTRSLLMSTGEAIYGIDLNLNCTFANAACVQKLGYMDAFELMGKNIHDLAHHSYADGISYPLAECPIFQAIKKGESVHVSDEVFWRKNGDSFPVEYRSEPIKSDGDVIGAVVSFSDISERLNMIQELQGAKDAAEQASRAKSSFLATMSHEIRTPMNGVVGMIDVLRRTELNESQGEMIQSVRESAYTLLRIIDDILDFSKIEAGHLELEWVPVSLEQLMEGVADNMLPIAAQKDVELMLNCQPDMPLIVGDPVRIRQILFNLVGNAIKFTSKDPGKLSRVFIEAEVVSKDQNQAKVALWVKDNGIGIKPAVQAQLFQPFAQGESSITRRFGGTGLGLSICRRLAHMMGGEIKVESEEGVGSVFTVHLSLEIAHNEAPPITLDLNGLNVLVVSNDNESSTVWMNYLTHAGAFVAGTAFEEAAVGHARDLAAKDGDLIVMIDVDGAKHDISNADRLRDLLRQEISFRLPHFVMMRCGRRRVARQTADDSLELDKSAIHRIDFLRAVAAACGRVSIPDKGPLASVDERVQPTCLTREEAEAMGRLILLAEDNETNQKVLVMQLHMLGFTADVAADGKEALARWRESRYALLLTDCHMPKMDGYSLARAIRQEEDGEKRMPIVAITADALKETRVRCHQAGMDDYLAKPVQLDILEQRLNAWLDMDKCKGDIAQKVTESGQSVGSEVVDPVALKEVLGIDDKMTLAGFYTDFLRTGITTVDEIQRAFDVRQGAEVGRLGHRLKSSARTIGAHTLADCCLALEEAGRAGDMPSVAVHMSKLPLHFSRVEQWIEQYVKAEAQE